MLTDFLRRIFQHTDHHRPQVEAPAPEHQGDPPAPSRVGGLEKERFQELSREVLGMAEDCAEQEQAAEENLFQEAPVTYEAFVVCNDYDDDFIFLFDGKPVWEGGESPHVEGSTPEEALSSLLQKLQVTWGAWDPDKIPLEGYRHVGRVRSWLMELADHVGEKALDSRDLTLGGNWNIRVVVQPKRGTFQVRILCQGVVIEADRFMHEGGICWKGMTLKGDRLIAQEAISWERAVEMDPFTLKSHPDSPEALTGEFGELSTSWALEEDRFPCKVWKLLEDTYQMSLAAEEA